MPLIFFDWLLLSSKKYFHTRQILLWSPFLGGECNGSKFQSNAPPAVPSFLNESRKSFKGKHMNWNINSWDFRGKKYIYHSKFHGVLIGCLRPTGIFRMDNIGDSAARLVNEVKGTLFYKKGLNELSYWMECFFLREISGTVKCCTL